MKLPSRADARLVLWLTLSSIIVGSIYGYCDTFVHGGDPKQSALQGAVTGALIGGTLSSAEIYLLGGAPGATFRAAPFLVQLSVRSAIYISVILLGLMGGAWLVASSVDIRPRALLFSVEVSLAMNFVIGVNRLLGQNVLFNFIAGRYHRPQREERVLLFIDLESSTRIAERLGETGFLRFLNRFLTDVTKPIVGYGGEIHKYVGDEVIVTWKLAAGVKDARCIRACFDALARLDALAPEYQRSFGSRANFRAGLHCGPVVIGELGSIKQEIAFLGDSMNTAARLEQACRDIGQRVLASAALIDRIAALPDGIAKHSLGRMQLRGKASEIEVYALEAVGSALGAMTAQRRPEPVAPTLAAGLPSAAP